MPVGSSPSAFVSVRDATFAVMRELGMTRIFGNPGTTEVPFLVDLPGEFDFMMGLHEGAVVGMATGYALATGRPPLVNLHTAPGLGNAVNAIANARDCHAPLVVVVGQQDRKQLHLSPFLTGRGLERIAGDYPVWTSFPARAQDVPGTIARAYHESVAGGGPALVVVPMGDWGEPHEPIPAGAPARVLYPAEVDSSQLDPLVELLAAASSPAIVTGAGTDGPAGFAAAVALAQRLGCPVWHEPFCGRAGFPEDHPQFAGHLDWHRGAMRATLSGHDLVIVLGTKAFQLYILDEDEPPVEAGTRVVVISAHAEDAHRSSCALAIVGPVAGVCERLAARLPQRPPMPELPAWRPPPCATTEPLSAGRVLGLLAELLPADAVVMEEAPSYRDELLARVPTRSPLGFFCNPNGALGFGLAGATGLRLAMPDRPVVALVGDGSAMFGIQALWSAATYNAGVLFIVMANGRYGVMDAQAAARGGTPAWLQFPGLQIATIAQAMGCPAVRVQTSAAMREVLAEALADLRERREPLLVEVVLP